MMMKNILFCVCISAISVSLTSQNNLEPYTLSNGDTVYNMVEVQPEFPGGQTALFQFLSKNVIYPDSAKYNGIEGKVYIEFIVDEEGNVINPTVKRGLGYGCDEAAIDAVRKMPRWKPGTMNGKPVMVLYTLPFSFRLS